MDANNCVTAWRIFSAVTDTLPSPTTGSLRERSSDETAVSIA